MKRMIFLLVISSIVYLCSTYIALLDKQFTYRFVVTFLWFASCILPIIFFASNKHIFRKALSFFQDIRFIFVSLVAILASFSFLGTYPYVAIYDQLRDGGLNTMEMAHGLLNMFGYGRYLSPGLIVPALLTPFYFIFGSSVLTYRFPDAVLAVLDTMLMFVAARMYVGKKAAFWSCLALITFPLHLYYARTEVAVFFSAIFTTFIFLLLGYFLTRKKTLVVYAVLGITFGVASGFYDAVKTVSFLAMGIVCFITVIDVVRKRYTPSLLFGIFLLIVFYIIGFGPKIVYTTPAIFFHTSEASFSHVPASFHALSYIGHILQNYSTSLQVYGYTPTISTHYPDFQPLLPPLLAMLLVGGFLAALFSRNLFLQVLCFFALALPFTNSAITTSLNSDNRLLPLLTVAAILIGYGISFLLDTLCRQKQLRQLRPALAGILALYILFQGFLFFWDQPANKAYGVQDYLSMHTVYALQENNTYQHADRFCLYVSPQTFQYFQLLHVQEQYQYFLPGKTISVNSSSNIPDNQLIASVSCNPIALTARITTQVFCKPATPFTCQKNSTPLFISTENASKIPYLSLPSPIPYKTLVIPPKPVFIP